MLTAKKANELSGHIVKDKDYYIKDIEKYILQQIETNKSKNKVNMGPCGDPLDAEMIKDSIEYVLSTDRYTKISIVNELELYGYKVFERMAQGCCSAYILTIRW